MFNERVMTVFDAVMKYLSAGEYVIVPKTNVREALDGFEQAEIDSSLNMLQMNELIAIRYADSDVYCLTVLPKGIREDERREETREAERRRQALLEEERKKREEALAAAAENGETQESVAEEYGTEAQEETESEREQNNEIDVREIRLPKFSYLKVALICGLSAFFGAFVAGMIALGIIIAKIG